ncbi:MAG: hypothetical protein M3131_05685 [Actinomycetota bacterium]|nr:hypothetical protein [Actinomycetota bacterium]
MKLRLTSLTAVAVALTASPAHGAVLNANKQCYREGARLDPTKTDVVAFGGGPFTPGGSVRVTRDGLPLAGLLPVNAAGFVSGLTTPPIIDPALQRTFTLVATDVANPALTGSVTRLVTQLAVNVRPSGGPPSTRRRISARGFTGASTLYAHIRRGRRTRTVRIARISGPCGTARARKRVFGRGAANGVYRVQFDSSRRYSAATFPAVNFRVRIRTIFRRRSASASASERWVRTD